MFFFIFMTASQL